MDKKRRLILTVIIAGLLLTSLIGTYAFFTSTANNTNKLSGTIKAGTMSLIFSDGNTDIGGSLMFGESITKKFIIENNGSLKASLSLDWKDLINTYLNGSLTYNLSYSTEENGTYTEIIPETNMPVSSGKLTQTLAGELSVPAHDIYYYNLTITLQNASFDQSDDVDAVFNTSFDVNTPLKYRYYKLTVDPNGGLWNSFTAPQEYLLQNEDTKEITGTPTRTGYDFLGWTLSGISSTLVDDTFTMGIGDTTLTAKWSLTPYTLTIDPNGGTYEGTTTKDITYLNSVDITTPTRVGHTFTGWEITGGRIENGKFILTEAKNASIKATWDVNTYKYIINHNKENIGGVGHTFVEADTGTAAYGTNVEYSLKDYTGFTAPEKEELIIGVENKKENGEDVYPPEVNKLDYVYTRNIRNLTINPNGGTYNGTTSNTTIPLYYEETIELPTSSGVQDTLNALEVTTKTGRPNFATVATTDETADGLYAMEDDYGTSYYYRGAVENNYVKFGKWAEGTTLADGSNASGKDMWWRIIRVNGDGSIRMIYDGTSAHANGESSTDRLSHTGKQYNSSRNDNAYVGWMYGTTGGTKEQVQTNINNSTLKDLLNTWYDETLNSYDQYIADAVYCNDRTTPGKSVTGWLYDTGLGTGTNPTGYGALGRLIDCSTNPWTPKLDSVPQFICPQKNDAFTVSDSIHGNATGISKSRKIGLITADEIVTAGGRFYKSDYSSNNLSYYLYKGSWYWALSPDIMSTDGYTAMLGVNSNGHLSGSHVSNTDNAVAPVISLKAEYAKTMTGAGSASDPYQIPENVSVLESPTKEGYNFANWIKTSGNGKLDSATFTMDTEDTTLEAIYTPKEYQVRFIANGGTVNTLSKKVTFNTKYGTLPTPTYGGYKFIGWFTEREGGVEITADTLFTTAIDQTLYARWKDTNTLQVVGSADYVEKLWSKKENIIKIVFENTMNKPATYAYEYDISSEVDKSVMAYLIQDETDNTKYIAHIQAIGTIYANKNSSWLLGNFTNLESIEGIEYLNTSKVSEMIAMFYGCGNLKTLNLNNFNTRNVTILNSIFAGCSSLTTLDLRHFDTSKVTDMAYIFCNCFSLKTINLNNFDTNKVTKMSFMFSGCSSLTSLDLSNFDTSNVTTMSHMFYACGNLIGLNLSNWNTSSVTNKNNIFANISPSVAITINNPDIKAWLIDASNNPKLTDANFNVV